MNAYLTLIKEKGILWFLNRSLYSLKLTMLRLMPATERIFEKKIPDVNRIDIFEYEPEKIQSFLYTLPQVEKDKIIKNADLACRGIINAFSSTKLDYGFPLQWQLNPLTGKKCNVKDKWYKIPDFDNELGDIKVIWEASRFSHFFLFARAFLLTNDKKYSEAYFSQLSDWVQMNPYSYGANYKCGQECSFRMISCLLTYPCFKEFSTDEDVENIKAIVRGSYKKVLSNFFYAHRCIKNNHTISELVGMIIGSWCCGDSGRMKYAYNTLDEIISEQFGEDGGYTQQSFNYQRLALMDLEIVLSIERKTGKCLNDKSKNRLLNSALQIYQCQDESGDVPNYGSNDGALILPLTTGGYRDFRQGINAVYALIQGSQLYNFPYLSEELLWLNYSPENCPMNETRKSIDFPATGLSVFRSKQSWMMIVCKRKMHHMDNGHIDLWVDGKNVLCDAGSYSYASDLGRELYSNKAHNTSYCEGIEQIRRVGPFAVYGQPKVKTRIWTEDSIEFVIQFSTGYEHWRRIEVTKRGYEIFDEVITGGRKGIIQFHALGNVEQIDDHSVRLDGCILKCNAEMQISKSKRSLYYLQEDETTCISVSNEGRIHTTIEIEEK